MAPKPTLEIGAAYVRVSTDDQTELSPDAQVRTIMDAAKADGYIIPKEFIFIEKKGISGKLARNRPEFQRMIATAKSQNPAPFSRLYLWKFSRFARNQEESTFYKGILRKKCKVEVKSVSEPIAEGMFGRLIETIIEWFDEYYSYNLSGEVIRGMTEKAMRHGYQSTPCLGYKAVGEGKPFAIDEKAYSIVEYIFRAYYSGKDVSAIARELNRRGLLTRRGSLFDFRSVHRILSNRFYIGEVTWSGITFQGTHETRPSVTDIFEPVQQRIQSEYRPIGRRDVSSTAHWLSGLIKCGICGGSLGYNRSINKGRQYNFFQCWKYAKGMHTGSCSISVKAAERATLDSMRTALESSKIDFAYLPLSEPKESGDEIVITEALKRLETKEQRIKDAYENEIDSLEEYKANKERLKAEREELESDLAQIKAKEKTTVKPSKEEMLKRVSKAYSVVSDPNIGYEEKGNALRGIIQKIIFDPQTRNFTYFYYIQ